MDTSLFVLEHIGRLSAAPSVQELHGLLRKVSWCMGFNYFHFSQQHPPASAAGAAGASPQALNVSGLPEEWRARYRSRNYLAVDPAVAHCLHSTEPLIWPTESGSKQVRQMWKEASDFDIRSAISIAVHDHAGIVSMLTLTRAQAMDIPETQMAINVARAVVSTAHFLALKLRPLERGAQLRRRLSERELQVLALCAEGLNTRDIATRLAIASRTVAYHLQSIFKKLSCRNRVKAVSVAVELGLLRTTG